MGDLETLAPRRAMPPLAIQPGLEANLDYDREKYRGGDADRGRRLFFAACSGCHPRGGAGLGPALFGQSVPEVARKIREGNGLLRGAKTEGAWKPFFGKDRLSDAQVADVAAFVSTLPPPSRDARADR
jgi:mono/diheme cytochrome c family protein